MKAGAGPVGGREHSDDSHDHVHRPDDSSADAAAGHRRPGVADRRDGRHRGVRRDGAFAAIARSIDVPLKVSGSSIPLLGFAEVTFVAAIIGTVLAARCRAGRIDRGRRS